MYIVYALMCAALYSKLQVLKHETKTRTRILTIIVEHIQADINSMIITTAIARNSLFIILNTFLLTHCFVVEKKYNYIHTNTVLHFWHLQVAEQQQNARTLCRRSSRNITSSLLLFIRYCSVGSGKSFFISTLTEQ